MCNIWVYKHVDIAYHFCEQGRVFLTTFAVIPSFRIAFGLKGEDAKRERLLSVPDSTLFSGVFRIQSIHIINYFRLKFMSLEISLFFDYI